MKKVSTYALFFVLLTVLIAACNKTDFQGPPAKRYSADVATAWIKLQMQLTKTTAGFSPGVTGRSFGYSGLTLYESIVPGMPGYQSVALQLGAPIPSQAYNFKHSYYWPASANAAMASIIKNLFINTSAANKYSIDSLESAFTTKFQQDAGTEELNRSADFGRQVAGAMFEWSKTDGGANDYLNLPSGYVPPVGPGLWIPTPPAFAPAAAPFSGKYRSFVKDIAAKVQVGPPTPYAESGKSDFFKMVNEVYTISQSLTHADTITVRFWADLPGQFNGPSHFTSVATQLIEKEHFALDDAAITYAKHGIALTDAGISCFKTKYTYNLVRPITYIRSVMGYPSWNTVIPTPPHPEYSSAHAVIMKATSVVLEDVFGKNYSFTDNTFSTTYGPRSYSSFSAYAYEGAWSRILGGIHYRLSAEVGIEQGKKVGDIINKIRFKK